MDTNSPIRISPPENSQPRQAPLPTDFALRWESPFEQEEGRPIVTVFLTQPAYAHIHVHAASDMQNEVGGVLVGQPCVDTQSGEMFLVIENVLAARYTQHSNVHLTFTQDSLVHFHLMVEKRCAGKQIVGWYHTHPRMGIFLSHYDTWLHENFFPEPWQVALVVEPHSLQAGFFIRQADSRLDPRHYYGFYEMNGCIGRSAVRWQNLSPIGRESE